MFKNSSISGQISQKLATLALLLVVTACYKVPMAEIRPSHQYNAKDLINEWRRHSAREPLPLVHNDDYYAPYTPPVRNRGNNMVSGNGSGYYYDPRMDNPNPPRAPYIADIDSDPSLSHSNGNVVTNDLLYAY